MKLTSYLWTLGLGMVGGAVAVTMLPKQPKVRRAVDQTADTIENAVETARESLTGSCGSCSSSCS